MKQKCVVRSCFERFLATGEKKHLDVRRRVVSGERQEWSLLGGSSLVSRCLLTMLSKFCKDRVCGTPSKWPNRIRGDHNYVSVRPGMILQVGFSLGGG